MQKKESDPPSSNILGKVGEYGNPGMSGVKIPFSKINGVVVK